MLAGPLRVGLVLELDAVHELDEESGTATAGFGRSSVAVHRRPRSELPWGADGLRWSTERWDWAVHVRVGTLPPDALVALRAQLPDR